MVPPSVATSSRESAKTTPTSGTSGRSTAKRPTGILLVYRRESTIISGSELKILWAPLTIQLIWMKSFTQDLLQVSSKEFWGQINNRVHFMDFPCKCCIISWRSGVDNRNIEFCTCAHTTDDKICLDFPILILYESI